MCMSHVTPASENSVFGYLGNKTTVLSGHRLKSCFKSSSVSNDFSAKDESYCVQACSLLSIQRNKLKFSMWRLWSVTSFSFMAFINAFYEAWWNALSDCKWVCFKNLIMPETNLTTMIIFLLLVFLKENRKFLCGNIVLLLFSNCSLRRPAQACMDCQLFLQSITFLSTSAPTFHI